MISKCRGTAEHVEEGKFDIILKIDEKNIRTFQYFFVQNNFIHLQRALIIISDWYKDCDAMKKSTEKIVLCHHRA